MSPPRCSSVTYFATGSSRRNSPRSTAWASNVAAKSLPTDARLKMSSGETRRPVSRSAKPKSKNAVRPWSRTTTAAPVPSASQGRTCASTKSRNSALVCADAPTAVWATRSIADASTRAAKAKTARLGLGPARGEPIEAEPDTVRPTTRSIDCVLPICPEGRRAAALKRHASVWRSTQPARHSLSWPSAIVLHPCWKHELDKFLIWLQIFVTREYNFEY